jgi:hypothetical protein
MAIKKSSMNISYLISSFRNFVTQSLIMIGAGTRMIPQHTLLFEKIINTIQAYKRRMGWTFTWASSLDSDFNYDFNTSFTEEQQRSGSIDYNHGCICAFIQGIR